MASPPPLDLEQQVFDALALELDAASELLAERDAVFQLERIAAHCEAARHLARAARLLLIAAASPFSE